MPRTPRSGCAWPRASRSTPRALLTFLGQRSVAGLEEWDGRTYRRTLALPHGHATVACQASPGGLLAEFRLADLRDLAPGVARVRRLFDLDADPVAIAEVLGADPMLGPLVAARPGLRVAGSVDPHEIVVRAIVGQQVSLAGAATVVGRFVAAHGEPLGFADPDADPRLPDRRPARPCRPRRAVDASGSRDRPRGRLPGPGRRRPGARPGRRPIRDRRGPAGPAGDRAVDRGLHRDARAR